MSEQKQAQTTLLERVYSRIRETELYKSIYQNEYPRDRKTRVQVLTNNLFLHLHPNLVTRYSIDFRYTWGLGGLSLGMFIILAISGAFLMFYYVPSVPQAYFTIRDLDTDIALGQFFRNLHRWAAHTMVILVFLHMCRVFYTGGYKGTRKFNWVVGVGLFFLTILMSFTGYLLPWDQLAYWAITVGANIAGSTPFIGKWARFVLFGGHEIGQLTLIRWYTLHVIFLPLIAFWMMLLHFYRIRKDGFSATRPLPIEDHPVLGPVRDGAAAKVAAGREV